MDLQIKIQFPFDIKKEPFYENYYLINADWLDRYKQFYNYELISKKLDEINYNNFNFKHYDEFEMNLSAIKDILKMSKICEKENVFPTELTNIVSTNDRIFFVPVFVLTKDKNFEYFYYKDFYIVNKKIKDKLCQDKDNENGEKYKNIVSNSNFNFYIGENTIFYNGNMIEIGIINKKGIFETLYHIKIENTEIKPEIEIKNIINQNNLDNYFKEFRKIQIEDKVIQKIDKFGYIINVKLYKEKNKIKIEKNNNNNNSCIMADYGETWNALKNANVFYKNETPFLYNSFSLHQKNDNYQNQQNNNNNNNNFNSNPQSNNNINKNPQQFINNNNQFPLGNINNQNNIINDNQHYNFQNNNNYNNINIYNNQNQNQNNQIINNFILNPNQNPTNLNYQVINNYIPNPNQNPIYQNPTNPNYQIINNYIPNPNQNPSNQNPSNQNLSNQNSFNQNQTNQNQTNQNPTNQNKTSIKQFNYVPMIGLENLGQTCYMNSVLQCFSNLYPITKYFLSPKKKEIIEFNTITMFNKEAPSLSVVYRELIDKLWNGEPKTPLRPDKFKKILGEINPLFKENTAGDSKDLAIFLIMQLHEELNNIDLEINSRNQVDIIQQNNMNVNVNPYNENEVLNYFFNDFKINQNSIISNNFYGINQSKFECQVCKMINMQKGITQPLYKYNYENFFYLEFPLEEVRKFMVQNNKMMGMNYQNTNQVTIDDCFKYNLKLNEMIGYCEKCGNNNAKIYSLTQIYSSPNILMIVLNRGKGLQFNIKIIFQEQLYVKTLNGNKLYELQSVVKHLGDSSATGHFISYCRSPIPNFHTHWYCYNDTTVVQTNNWSNITDVGVTYILFYQLKQ